MNFNKEKKKIKKSNFKIFLILYIKVFYFIYILKIFSILITNKKYKNHKNKIKIYK